MLNDIRLQLNAGNQFLARNPRGQMVWVVKMTETVMGPVVTVQRGKSCKTEIYKVSDLKKF